MKPSRLVPMLLATALLGPVVACSGTPSDAAVFVTQPDFQPGGDPPCLMHQNAEPNAAYQGGENGQSEKVLIFLAYYTAAGKLPFCDGKPATDTDKSWGHLYEKLTSSADNVTTILG